MAYVTKLALELSTL